MERAAAGDLQRAIYAATGELVPIGGPKATEYTIIAVGHSAGQQVDLSQESLGDQGFVLKTIISGPKTVIVAAGATPVANSYAAYTLAERYGAGFYLGGDALPTKPKPFFVPKLDEVRKPVFQVRGVLPWYNFFDSPTAWNIEDYRLFIDQLAKSKNNFLGFHSYDGEPFCAYRNREGKLSCGAPLVSTAQPTWGTSPMKTSDFGFGTGKYFAKDYFGADCSVGCKTSQDGIKNAQKLLAEALWYAKARGIRTCVGFEVSGDPTAPGALDELELRLQNLVCTYPMLDYVWIWEPEALGIMGSEQHPSRSDFGAYYRRWKKYFSDISDPRRKSEAVRMGIYALAAHRILQHEAPHVRMILSGWGGDNHLHFTDFYPGYDKILPKDIIFSALDNIVVSDTVSAAYGKLSKNREFWPIPWFEYDGDQWFPQPNTERFYNACRDALDKGAKGLLAIHWRTRDVEESHAYISQFAWDKRLGYEEFYRRYAQKCYGSERAADLLMALQNLGYRWIGGPGQMECGGFAWNPAPDGNLERLLDTFVKHNYLASGERMDYLVDTKDWAVNYNQAAELLNSRSEARTMINTLASENRRADGSEQQVLRKSLGQAYSALCRAEHAYACRMSNRGELGVLATINAKAWTNLNDLLTKASKVGVQVDTHETQDGAPFSVSSILRSATAFTGRRFRISAVVHQSTPRSTAEVVYRSPGQPFKEAKLQFLNTGRIEGAIPASDVKGQMLEYYIAVTLGQSMGKLTADTIATWPENAPEHLKRVSVVPVPNRRLMNVVAVGQHSKWARYKGPGFSLGPMLVDLDWQEKDNGTVRAFRVLRKRSGNTSWREIAFVRDHWFEDRSVDSETSYDYRIVDADSRSDVARYSGVAVPRPPLPAVPEVAASAGPARVRLKWTGDDVLASGYSVYRADSPNGPFTKLDMPSLMAPSAGERRRSIPAEPGKTMFYHVRAVSLDGRETEASKSAAVTPLAADAPPILSLKFDGSDPVKAAGVVRDQGINALPTGVDNYLQLPHSETYNTQDEITVQFRVKLVSPGVMPVFISHGAWDMDGFFVQYLGGRIRFFLAGVGTLDTGSLELGKWTHIAATYDGSEMAVYIDGKRAGSKPASGLIRPANRPLTVGQYSTPDKQYEVDGYMADVRIYSYARSREQIDADCGAAGG